MPVKLQKLLVAIDGSSIADEALHLALHIARAYSSRIDIVNIEVPPPSSPPLNAAEVIAPQIVSDSPVPIIPPQRIEEPQAGVEGKPDNALIPIESLLEERRKWVTEEGGANLQCEILLRRSDDPGDEITKLAAEGGYDLVALGNRGLSGLQSLLLGSTSKKVVRHAKCSVLVAKESSGAGKEPPKRILVGYDGSAESKRALEVSASLGKELGAQVDTLSVFSLPLASEDLTGTIIPTLIEQEEKQCKTLADEASKFLAGQGILNHDGKLAGPVTGSISKTIVDRASKGSYDLVVVGHRGFGRLKSIILGSVASGVADDSETNVLIVR
ncbi:MAG TPA: universal stress protein [Nitrososphaerales archaeon]|nr:universal stress protein [Nitrososphaerales archaeon]